MKKKIKNILKKVIYSKYGKYIIPLYWYLNAKSQSNNLENDILKEYSERLKIDKSFIEFGFSPFEYNCINLTKLNYKGLLIDANNKNCDLANNIFSFLRLNTKVEKYWIKKSSIEPIIDFVKNNDNKLGLLSIDIDGNDYWIMKEICSFIKPEIIITEHNASFGTRSLTVNYDDNFDRHNYHKSGWYHGASITAFYKLLKDDYELINNIDGNNLIFIRSDKVKSDMVSLSPINAFKEHKLRNNWSGTNSKLQWEQIKGLKYTEV